MSKFELYLVKNNKLIPLTICEKGAVNSGGKTYDEDFSIDVHNKRTLSFKARQYDENGSIDPLAFLFVHGAELKLVDKYQEAHSFFINRIAYVITQKNVELSITATDAFSHVLAKTNVGYSITDDVTSASYIGPSTLDTWARKIVSDCNLTWSYIEVDSFNAQLIQLDPQHETYNTIKSFSVSGANAYTALTALGDLYGMNLKIDDISHSFSFIPAKNPQFRGIFFHPEVNLADLSVSTDSQALVTILNVTGPKDVYDNEITLIPAIPTGVYNFIKSGTPWDESVYSPTLYSDYYTTMAYPLTAIDTNFLALANQVPWLENKLINFDYFLNSGMLSESEYQDIHRFLYDELRIVNGKLLVESQSYWTHYGETATWLTDLQIACEDVGAEWYAAFDDYLNGSTETIETIFKDYIVKMNTYNSFRENQVVDQEKELTNICTTMDSLWDAFAESITDFRRTATTIVTGTTTQLDYYATNKNNSIDQATMRKCAEIKSQLTNTWNIAKQAALLLGWYLPNDWDKFTDLTEWDAVSFSGNDFIVNNTIVPQFRLNTWNEPQTDTDLDTTTFRKVIWKYSTNSPSNNYIPASEISNIEPEGEYIDPAGKSYYIKQSKYLTNGTLGLSSSKLWFALVPGQVCKEYVLDTHPGKTLFQITDGLGVSPKTGLSGPSFMRAMKIKMKSFDTEPYDKALAAQKQTWFDFKAKYPSICLETTYTNDTATTSQFLYEAAMAQFKDLSNPEPDYSVGILDNFEINDISILNIQLGDQVRISKEILKDEQTEIKKMLENVLFVTSIKYNLRNDMLMNINVNKLKYTDILISRLARIL